jgi:Amt family ammonium transporter
MIALVLALAFIIAGSFLILKITDLISPMTVSSEEKLIGSDFSQHGENLHPAVIKTEAAAA